MSPTRCVLVPGLNNTRSVFARVCRVLDKDIEALPVDNPALETVEAIARHHLDALPDRFWLAGFSFGGYVALAMLEAAPQRILGIALVCSSPLADSPAAVARRQVGIDAALDGRYHAMVSAQAAQAFHPDSHADGNLASERAAMIADYGSGRFIAHARAANARPDRTSLLDGRIPTLVVGGSHDTLFTPAAIAAWADPIPGVRKITIDGAGHLVPMEQPRALAEALARWMRQDKPPAMPA